MAEVWKDIPGYEGRYSVSDCGHVMSWNYKERGSPALLKLRRDKKGYARTWLCLRGNEKSPFVHALVLLAFVGPKPPGLQINHKDGNKQNNSLCNLEYCTASENNCHALRTGLRVMLRAEKHWNGRLTDEDVAQIRILLLAGNSQPSIASLFKVTQSHISHIKRGKHRVIHTGQSEANNLRLAG